MSWSDPEKIAAMEALKDQPAPVNDPVAENLLADLEKSAGNDLGRITQCRVMRLLTPVILEMKAAFEAGDAAKVADMSQGIMKGLGFGLGSTLPFVPPSYQEAALKMLFQYSRETGLVSVTSVRPEPKK